MAKNVLWNTGQSNAEWIWLAGLPKPKNAYVNFRKAFVLSKKPKKAALRVSADCKYVLFVNGRHLGRGPVTMPTEHKQFDEYDCAKLLKNGKNVLAALVLHRQYKNSRLIPVRGGFILELDAEGKTIVTDSSWKVRRAVECKSDTPYMTHQYGNQEWVDARKSEPGWEGLNFNDKKWSTAAIVKNAKKYWPENIESRMVPHMLREKKNPLRLVTYFGLTSQGRPPQEDAEPARQIELGYPMSSIAAYNTRGITNPKKGRAVFIESAGDGVGIVVDLGEEMYGYPFIDIECPGGVTVDIGHGEILSRNRLQTVLMPGSACPQLYADRYVTHSGRQRFETFDTKGCRYLEVHFRRLAPFYTGAKIIIHEIGIMRSRWPVKRAGTFECSDEKLNAIWDICRRTVEVKYQDWHICDAQREQNCWLECFQDFVYLQVLGRCDLIRQTLHMFARAQLDSGFMLSTIPTIFDGPATPERLYLLSTVYYPLTVAIDRLYGGSDARQAFWLEACRRLFDGLFKYADADGVPVNLPGSHFVEWSALDSRPSECGRAVKKSWESAAVTGTIILSLEYAARLADEFGRSDLAVLWREKADRIRRAADKRHWSRKRQAYMDGVYDGAQSESVSQTTNAFAALARFGSEGRIRQALATILKPKKIDVPCTVHSMTMTHQALEAMNMDAGALETIRKKWGRMIELGATTAWEAEKALEVHNGLCFGFSAHPLTYFARNLLGVVPMEPGYKKFRVCIAPSDLEFAGGRIATPAGYIEVDWKKKGRKLHLDLTVPKGTKAVVAPLRFPKGITPTVRSNNISVNGKRAKLTREILPSSMFSEREMPGVEISHGRHRVVFG